MRRVDRNFEKIRQSERRDIERGRKKRVWTAGVRGEPSRALFYHSICPPQLQ